MIILYNNKKPFVEGVCLNELTETMETPFYVYSQKSITDAYNKIKKAINAEIFYAVKANSNQAIISIMKSLGAGADVVSIGELKRALKAGIDSKMYAGHSLRSGFATSAALAGASLEEIKRTTGHKSDKIVQGYLDSASLVKRNAAKKLDL